MVNKIPEDVQKMIEQMIENPPVAEEHIHTEIENQVEPFCDKCGRPMNFKALTEYHVSDGLIEVFPWLYMVDKEFDAFIKDAIDAGGSVTIFHLDNGHRFFLMEYSGATIMITNFSPKKDEEKKTPHRVVA